MILESVFNLKNVFEKKKKKQIRRWTKFRKHFEKSEKSLLVFFKETFDKRFS